mgnify:CR=1 FL=1
MRKFRLRSTLAASLAFLPVFAHAQAYPAKPVRVIVPFAPGGVMDVSTRAVAGPLQERAQAVGDDVGRGVLGRPAQTALELAVLDAERALSPEGPCTVFGTGERLPLGAAAFVNGSMPSRRSPPCARPYWDRWLPSDRPAGRPWRSRRRRPAG